MRKGGFTLAELIVALGILVLVGFTGFWTMQSSRTIMHSSIARTQWSRDFYQSSQQLVEILEEIPISSLTLQAQGENTLACSFLSGRDADGVYRTREDGSTHWQAYRVLCLRRQQLRLMQSPLPDTPLRDPIPWTQQVLLAHTDSPSQILCRHVERFQLQIQEPGLLVQLRAGSPDGQFVWSWQRRVLTP